MSKAYEVEVWKGIEPKDMPFNWIGIELKYIRPEDSPWTYLTEDKAHAEKNLEYFKSLPEYNDRELRVRRVFE